MAGILQKMSSNKKNKNKREHGENGELKYQKYRSAYFIMLAIIQKLSMMVSVAFHPLVDNAKNWLKKI